MQQKLFVIFYKYMAFIVNQYNTLNAAHNIIKAGLYKHTLGLKSFKHS